MSNIKSIKYLLILLGFFSSISIFISDILIFGIIIIWFLDGNLKQKIKSIKSCGFSLSIIAFFVFYLIGLMWGEWNFHSLKWIREQSLLLIIPIIISMSIEKSIIHKGIISFLAGMFINTIVSIGAYLNAWNMNYHHYPNENVAVGFLDHFDHSVFLAFASLIIICKFIESNNTKSRILCFLITSLFLVSLFLSHGRAGQYVFLISIVLLLIVKLFRYPKYLLLSLGLITMLLTTMNVSSSTFNKRLSQGINESNAFLNLIEYSSINTSEITVTDTAMGDRLTYLINYIKIIKNNFWFGSGTGRSLIEYELLENKIFPNLPARPPHNNYVFILCEIGIIGLIFWLNIFIQLFIKIYNQKKSQNASNFIKFLFPIIFMLICLTDEYLIRHNSTLFFCFFTSLFCIRKDVLTRDLEI